MTYTDVRLQLADNVIDELRSRGFLKPNEPLNAAIARVIVTVYPRRHPCDAHPGARASPVRASMSPGRPTTRAMVEGLLLLRVLISVTPSEYDIRTAGFDHRAGSR